MVKEVSEQEVMDLTKRLVRRFYGRDKLAAKLEVSTTVVGRWIREGKIGPSNYSRLCDLKSPVPVSKERALELLDKAPLMVILKLLKDSGAKSITFDLDKVV